MNKSELVEAVAGELDQSKAAAGRAVEAVLDAITRGLLKDGEVSLVGFGSFRTRKRAARTGRNPQTGQPIQIAAGTSISFKAGQPLKEKFQL